MPIYYIQMHGAKPLDAGCRYMNSGMDTLMMVNTIGRVNYEKLVEMSEKICQLIEQN